MPASAGLLSFAVCLFQAAVASGASAGAEPEPKTHTLFMGADLDLQVNQDYSRVRDVSGNAFVVRAKGKDVAVPMSGGPITLRVQQIPQTHRGFRRS